LVANITCPFTFITKGLQSQKNVLIESCTLHLRNLVDFFYQSNAKADDVIAADYVADWDKKCPAISSLLEKARTRANKEVAHLTTKRIAGSPPEKAWDFDAVSAELRPAIAKDDFSMIKPECSLFDHAARVVEEGICNQSEIERVLGVMRGGGKS